MVRDALKMQVPPSLPPSFLPGKEVKKEPPLGCSLVSSSQAQLEGLLERYSNFRQILTVRKDS